jgi:hypothetical protein
VTPIPAEDSRASVEQLADHHQVLQPGEVLVDRGVLAGEADVLTYLPGLGGDS